LALHPDLARGSQKTHTVIEPLLARKFFLSLNCGS
jgi:hypothetical protein